jgi:hypothetical protein
MSENFEHNCDVYSLAIEHGDYRTALRFAIREYRRLGKKNVMWATRVAGTFTRRNRQQTRSD